jgi:Ca2+-binding EF-hand superfamily protein
VETAISRLFLLELSYAGQLEQMKRKLTSQFDFSAQQLYREVDDCNMQFIDFVAMKRFLQKCGIVMSSSRIVAIVRRLDIDADAKLSQSEFMEAIMP